MRSRSPLRKVLAAFAALIVAGPHTPSTTAPAASCSILIALPGPLFTAMSKT